MASPPSDSPLRQPRPLPPLPSSPTKNSGSSSSPFFAPNSSSSYFSSSSSSSSSSDSTSMDLVASPTPEKEKKETTHQVYTIGDRLRDVMSHKFDTVSNQLEAGLSTSLYKMCQFIETMCRIQGSTQESVKAAKSIPTQSNKELKSHDKIQPIVSATGMAQALLLQAQNSYTGFTNSVLQDFIGPLNMFYSSNLKRKVDIDREYKRKINHMITLQEELGKSKDICEKQIKKLKKSTQSRDYAEESRTLPSRLTSYSKLGKKVRAEKDKTIKLIEKYQSDLTYLRNYHKKLQEDTLDWLDEFEHMERDRLSLLSNYLTKLQVLFSTLVIELQRSAELLQQTNCGLDPDKMFDECLSNWGKEFGRPPDGVKGLEYGLSCTLEELRNDHYMGLPPESEVSKTTQDNPGTLPASEPPPLEKPSPRRQMSSPSSPSTPGSGQFYTTFSPSPDPTSRPNSPFSPNTTTSTISTTTSSRPPPPLPHHNSTTSTSSNFSASTQSNESTNFHPTIDTGDSIVTSASRISSLETVLFEVEALYPFTQEAEKNGEITYITLVPAQRVRVFDTDDPDWWFGEAIVTGAVGYFPSQYVKKIE